jgi:hypothetical protein
MMNELFSFLDKHNLTISFMRSHPRPFETPDHRWYANVPDLRYERPDGDGVLLSRGPETVFAFGETQEEAANGCLALITSQKCFRVVSKHVEERVALEVAQ